MNNIKPIKILCRCGCGKYLRPNYERERIPNPHPLLKGHFKDGKAIKIIGYGYMNNGFFNSLTCGFRWAIRNVKK
jgi:hypothetical protein